MDVVYLDYNCFQRGFDDPRQVRIQLETLACQEIFERAKQDRIRLVWSFMHEDETRLCPFPERQHEALRLSQLCSIRLDPDEAIRSLAKSYQDIESISAKDAIHFACAVHLDVNYFLTCDDRFLKQAGRLPSNVDIINPIDYVRQERSDER